jgi:hypothetical protein
MDGVFTVPKTCIRTEKRYKRQINNVVSRCFFDYLALAVPLPHRLMQLRLFVIPKNCFHPNSYNLF